MDQRIKLLGELSFFWAVIASFVLLTAWKKKFFKVTFSPKNKIVISFGHVLIAFAIYLTTVIFITPLILKVLNITTQTYSAISYVSISNILSFLLVALFLGIYYFKKFNLFRLNIPLWDNDFYKNLKVAFVGWIIVTPLVLFFSQFSDLIVSKIFKIEKMPDQLAVSYVKTSLDSPIYFFLAFFTVVFLAPIVEETLFRGFLQTWLKKHLGPIFSIILTSIFFVVFHFSTSQKIGNIVILSALFPLAFFLSFIYEKQKTLICPILLHAIFNLSSILSLALISS